MNSNEAWKPITDSLRDSESAKRIVERVFQPEALRLADLLEYDAINNVGYHKPLVCASAAELRRLHEVNAELLAALKAALPFMENAEEREDFEFGEWRRIDKIAEGGDLSPEIVQVRAAIKKAEEKNCD